MNIQAEKDRWGGFYVVGLGPGDGEYLTLKALRFVRNCSVLALPRTKEAHSLAADILESGVAALRELFGEEAAQGLAPEEKEVLYLDFPMCRQWAAREANYDRQAGRIAEKLQAGHNVCMAVLGDVSVYATSSYLVQRLLAAGFRVELAAGVPSFCGMGAVLKKSLTRMDKPLHILPVGAGGWEEALALPGSKVLMKSGAGLPEAKEAIRRAGLMEKACLVKDCGLPGQRICCDLEQDAGAASYFTTIFIEAEMETGVE